MKTYAFIFARGGSKGIPKKNLRILDGIPLLVHSIRTAKNVDPISRIFVSSDDEEILSTALDWGVEIIKRPKSLAQDDSPEWFAWRHAVESLPPFDTFVSIPTTAPLRNKNDIKKCIDLFMESDADAVVTGQKAARHPSFNMVKPIPNGCVQLVLPSNKEISRRQDTDILYDLTTVAYVTSPAYILNKESLFDGKVRIVEIPKHRAIDIDDELDFAFAELLISQKK